MPPRGEGIPVNPAIIVWARERAGLTLAEAAQKFRHIAAWETGETLPTYPQLEALSDELKLPIAVFFFPAPPHTPPIRDSFRTLPDAEYEQIPRRVNALLRKAKALQLNLPELTHGRNPAERLITRDLAFPVSVTPEVMTKRVREYLGVTLETQMAWRDDETALKEWRAAFYRVGIFVFKDAFRAENYSGFCLYDDMFPIIYVNNSCAITRQIFTLFHELAHLLFHTSGISPLDDGYIPKLAGDQRRIEVICNRFSSQFLVPPAAFDQAIAGLDPNEATAEHLATRFHVSREAIYRIFLDRGWINQVAYTAAAKAWAQQRKGGSGGDHYRTKIAYLGRDYIALALKQYHQNHIDETQLGDYLDTKPRNVSRLEDYFSTSNG